MTYQSFDDARQIPFVTVLGEDRVVLVGRGGTVTSQQCEIASQLSSGDVPLSIDSTPVAALHTEYPLWRDLTPGLKGSDVTAVQNELTRLGYNAGTSAKMDPKTIAAVKSFFADRGYVKPDGTLSRSTIIWLPTQSVAIGSCKVTTASTVEAGDAFIAAGARLIAMEPAQPPDGFVPGPRIVTSAGLSAPVGDDGRVTDPAFLAAVAGSPTFIGLLNSTEEKTAPQITLGYVLSTPLDTAGIPAGTLFGVTESAGCVSEAGVVHPVTIVSSMLGSTYVTFDDGAAPRSLDLITAADRTGQAGPCS